MNILKRVTNPRVSSASKFSPQYFGFITKRTLFASILTQVVKGTQKGWDFNPIPMYQFVKRKEREKKIFGLFVKIKFCFLLLDDIC